MSIDALGNSSNSSWYIRQNILIRDISTIVVASEIHELLASSDLQINSGGFLDLAIRKSKRQNQAEKWLAIKMHGILPSCFLLI